MTTKAAVIGDPIAHSLSPRVHGWWLRQYDIKGKYLAERVSAEGLEQFLTSLSDHGFAGINVTIPHKQAILPYVDYLDETAHMIGAANTITVRDGKLFASNTDVYGFVTYLQQKTEKDQFLGKKAVLLGAGGAAKAICAGLLSQEVGIKELVLVNRTRARAEQLKEELHAGITSMMRRSTENDDDEIKASVDHFINEIIIADWEERNDILSSASLLVNSTSLGMVGQPVLELDISALPEDAVVYDIVFNPLETPLLAAASARGLTTIDGLGMLLHQAAPGFKQWFDPEDTLISGLPEVTEEQRNYVLEGL